MVYPDGNLPVLCLPPGRRERNSRNVNQPPDCMSPPHAITSCGGLCSNMLPGSLQRLFSGEIPTAPGAAPGAAYTGPRHRQPDRHRRRQSGSSGRRECPAHCLRGVMHARPECADHARTPAETKIHAEKKGSRTRSLVPKASFAKKLAPEHRAASYLETTVVPAPSV